jgi:hypothetical protein
MIDVNRIERMSARDWLDYVEAHGRAQWAVGLLVGFLAGVASAGFVAALVWSSQ